MPSDLEDILSDRYQSGWREDLARVPGDCAVSKEDYEDQLKDLQKQLLIAHNHVMAQKRRAIIVFEGWDAAGKGGAIKRLTARWDPRGYKVWPIAAPDAHERARHYLYRFWKRLPGDGEIAIFDRSWYGRVLVERVEGFCDEAAWSRAYQEICEFERTLVDNGSRIIKFFLDVSPEEQAERFLARVDVPYKRWKITAEDFRNRSKRGLYAQATQDMLQKTHTQHAPWIVIPAEQKRFARIAVLSQALSWINGFCLADPAPLDPELEQLAQSLRK
ncbi:MAG: polyphosphate kinase [Pseudomonadota bacterium]